jgi:integral membrane protein
MQSILALFRTALGQLRVVGFVEGWSFIILCGIAMPLKYFAGSPAAVYYTGRIHGALFIAYVVYVLRVGVERSWSFKTMAIALAASIIPFGTFYADKHIFAPAQTAETTAV